MCGLHLKCPHRLLFWMLSLQLMTLFWRIVSLLKLLWLAEESHCELVFEVWTHPWIQSALGILSTKILKSFETMAYFLMKQWPEIFLIPKAQISRYPLKFLRSGILKKVTHKSLIHYQRWVKETFQFFRSNASHNDWILEFLCKNKQWSG